MVDEPNQQYHHSINREVCKNAEKYREIMIHISNEVGNMPDWLAYRLVCKDFKEDSVKCRFDPLADMVICHE